MVDFDEPLPGSGRIGAGRELHDFERVASGSRNFTAITRCAADVAV